MAGDDGGVGGGVDLVGGFVVVAGPGEELGLEVGEEAKLQHGGSMPKRSNPFQKLTACLMTAFQGPNFEVQESVLSVNKRTKAIRELDVLIKSRVDPKQSLLVECRDHKRKQSVEWIDALEGKARRLKFKHVVAVSSSGFTKPAMAEAKERKIVAVQLAEAERTDWTKWRFALNCFGLNINFPLRVTGVQFVTRLKQEFSHLKRDPRTLFFFNTSKRTKIAVSDWIAGFVNDPQMLDHFPKPPEPNSVQHFTYDTPCDPEIVLLEEPPGRIVPLERVILNVDRINADYQVQLEHFKLGAERFHVGQLEIMDYPCRLVINEREDKKVQMMLETTDNSPLPVRLTPGKTDLRVSTTSGNAFVLPEVESEHELRIPKVESTPKRQTKNASRSRSRKRLKP